MIPLKSGDAKLMVAAECRTLHAATRQCCCAIQQAGLGHTLALRRANLSRKEVSARSCSGSPSYTTEAPPVSGSRLLLSSQLRD